MQFMFNKGKRSSQASAGIPIVDPVHYIVLPEVQLESDGYMTGLYLSVSRFNLQLLNTDTVFVTERGKELSAE